MEKTTRRARGLFISFEGVDGSGKSTQAARLQTYFQERQIPATFVREPGGTPISEKIRALLLDPANAEMSFECELLLYEASRAQLVREVIEPALASGDVVVCDRYLDSTFAYQAYGRHIDEALVKAANAMGSCGVMPDITLVFDIDPTEALERACKEGADRLELAGVALEERVREGYCALAAAEPARVQLIDARGTIDEVARRVEATLADYVRDMRG
ncbi:MAG: dTMP kinase [Atopobiaceae bacterium]|jgi:dTMP kinase